MIVPDETKYKPGDKRVEDMKGFQLCIHCARCPMTYQGQVRHDGSWLCMYFQRWKAGNDILEYRCEGYRMKRCSLCRNKELCYKGDAEKRARGNTFCNKFRLIGASTDSMMSGRARKLSERASDAAIEAEERYWEMKNKEFEEAYGRNGEEEPIDDQERQ